MAYWNLLCGYPLNVYKMIGMLANTIAQKFKFVLVPVKSKTCQFLTMVL